MSKITIVSREDRALLIDVTGCASFRETIEQLSSAFLSGNQFWQGQTIDLNLGSLLLNKAQAAQIVALIKGVGAQLKNVFARSASTFGALEELELKAYNCEPDSIVSVAVLPEEEANKPLSKTISSKNTTGKSKSSKEDKESISDSKEKEITKTAEAVLDKVLVFEGQGQAESPTELNAKKSTTVLVAGNMPTIKDQNEAKLENKKKSSLYLRQTLRAGQAITHNGDLIIVGDVNAGAEIIAEGDITVWGSLRGIAHAGSTGNTKAEIRALRLIPIQIRIADAIARSPDRDNRSQAQDSQFSAETARLVNGKIRIQHKALE